MMDQKRIRLLWLWCLAVFVTGLTLTVVWAQYHESRTDRVTSGERIRGYEEIPLLTVGDGQVR